MVMSKKEAIKRKFEFEYYNPYHTRFDIVFLSILICIFLFFAIFGMFKITKISLIINSIIGLSVLIVQLIDLLTSEKIQSEDLRTKK